MAGTRPSVRLRQMAVVVADRDGVVDDLRAVLGLAVAHDDPGMARLGLHNAVLPVGEQFIEVVAAVRPGTSAGRFRERRGRDTGYMLIFQTDDHPRHRDRVEALGVRIVARFDAEGFTNMQLHPADTGGTFFEIDQQEGETRWSPAGEEWHDAVRTDLVTGIAAAEVACVDPAAVAERWADLLCAPPPVPDDSGGHHLALSGGEVRFVPAGGGDEGITAIDVVTPDATAVLTRAAQRGLRTRGEAVALGGIRLQLVPDVSG